MLPDKRPEESEKPEERPEVREAKPMPIEAPMVSVEHYEGLLPHPRLMREWEEIVPGSAKSIFTRFENQSDHRLKIEERVVRARNFKLYVGPFLGLGVALAAIGAGTWIALSGAPIPGALLSASGLASLVAPFITNEIRRDGKKQKGEDD